MWVHANVGMAKTVANTDVLIAMVGELGAMY